MQTSSLEPLENADLLTEIVRALVKNPEDVSVKEEKTQHGFHFRIICAPSDAGLVIGTGGTIINAIRTLYKSFGAAEDMKLTLDLDESVKALRPAA